MGDWGCRPSFTPPPHPHGAGGLGLQALLHPPPLLVVLGEWGCRPSFTPLPIWCWLHFTLLLLLLLLQAL